MKDKSVLKVALMALYQVKRAELAHVLSNSVYCMHSQSLHATMWQEDPP